MYCRLTILKLQRFCFISIIHGERMDIIREVFHAEVGGINRVIKL